MKPNASAIREQMDERGLSVRSLAARLGVHHAHLDRVLKRERPGSRALLEAALAIIESTPYPASECPHDWSRLFDSAIHVFFLKRGEYQSAIFSTPVTKQTR